MRITLDVPFYVGQKVWRAVYSYQNGRGEQTNLITDWVVVGYKLDELGHFSCICQRIQGEVKRIEYLGADKLFATKAEAELHLISQAKPDSRSERGTTIPQSASQTAPFRQGGLEGGVTRTAWLYTREPLKKGGDE